MIKEKELLGPFLYRISPNSVGFWVAQGPHRKLETIKVRVLDSNGDLAQTVVLKPLLNTRYGVQLAETEPLLEPDYLYRYQVVLGDGEWMPQGMTAADLHFRTLHDPSLPAKRFDFLLASCHGVEAFEHRFPNRNSWEMWKRLSDVLDASPNCRLGILGGDQVYMDDTFGEDLARYDPTDGDRMEEQIFQAYLTYWSNTSYRKIMAKLPCVLMWDDHDLIDGWGSREEAHRKGDAEKWRSYGEHLKNAFSELQASRNPASINKHAGFTFCWSWKGLAFIGLDLRSERSFNKSTHHATMLSPQHKEAIETYVRTLSTLGVKTLFLVSPVTVVRMNSKTEKLLGNLANALWSLTARLGYAKPFRRAVAWLLVFSLLHFVLYLYTPRTMGFFQAGTLAILSISLLISGWIRRYLPQLKGVSTTVLGTSLGLSLIVMTRSFLRAGELSALVEDLRVGFERAVLSSWSESVISVVLAILSVLLVSKEAPKWRRLTGFGFAGALGIITWWRGLPGWSLDTNVILGILVYIPLGLFTVAAFALALLERLGAIDLVAGLDDDLRDAWSSESNATEYQWLVRLISEIFRKQGVRTIILSGDIHTGGLSEIQISHKSEQPLRVPQITSSPISYVPMEPLVEKVTSGQGVVSMPNFADYSTSATNLFYRSERNFAVVLTHVESSQVDVNFHFEDLSQPIQIQNV